MKLLKLTNFLFFALLLALAPLNLAYACEDDEDFYCDCSEDCEYDYNCNYEDNCGCAYTYEPEQRIDAHDEDSPHLAIYNKAMQGDSDALCRLGDIYFDPIHVTQDWPLALSYYIQAAEKGHVEAMFKAGELYRVGRGTDRSFNDAIYWYEKAAEQGHTDSIYSMITGIYDLYFNDDDKIFEWANKLAELNDPRGIYILAVCYHLATGTERNDTIAFEYAVKASKHNYEPVYYLLGEFYDNGYGVEQNTKKAVAWHKKSVENYPPTDLFSAMRIAQIYDTGENNVKKNKKKALEYYTFAARRGIREAQEIVRKRTK